MILISRLKAVFMVNRTAARAGIGYTIANLLIRGIGFLTLPLFSRLLDTHDFGLYNIFIAYDSVLVCVIGLAFHSSVKSANWEFPGRINEYVSTLSLVYVINAAVFCAIALIFGPQISGLLGLDTVVVVVLVLHSFGAAVVSLYNAKISLNYSYVKYMAVATINSVGNVVLSLFLIFCFFDAQRFLGRIIGATVVVAGLGAALVLHFWYQSRPKLNREYLSFGLRYSLPIVPHGVSQVVLAQFDRLMVGYMVSAEAAGIYGLAANLMVILTVLTDSISTVWTTWFYEAMEGESANKATGAKRLTAREVSFKSEVIRARSSQLVRAFAVFSFGLMAVGPEIVFVLGGSAYMDGAYCIFGMILSGYCIFLYNLIVVGEYYKQRTQWIMLATVFAALMNIGLNYFAISQFGYVAAAYTTFISYILYVFLHWRVSKALLGFSIIDVRTILPIALLLACGALVDFIAIHSFFVRVFANLIICLPVLVPLLRSVGGISGLKTMIGR